MTTHRLLRGELLDRLRRQHPFHSSFPPLTKLETRPPLMLSQPQHRLASPLSEGERDVPAPPERDSRPRETFEAEHDPPPRMRRRASAHSLPGVIFAVAAVAFGLWGWHLIPDPSSPPPPSPDYKIVVLTDRPDRTGIVVLNLSEANFADSRHGSIAVSSPWPRARNSASSSVRCGRRPSRR